MIQNHLQVKIMTRRDVIVAALSATDSNIYLVKCLMDVNKGIDYGSPMHGRKLEMAICYRECRRRRVYWQV